VRRSVRRACWLTNPRVHVPGMTHDRERHASLIGPELELAHLFGHGLQFAFPWAIRLESGWARTERSMWRPMVRA
jgi:hypothetical protein